MARPVESLIPVLPACGAVQNSENDAKMLKRGPYRTQMHENRPFSAFFS
jgi:hypothetical protein